MRSLADEYFLFGATSSWNGDDWTASDDRVRGGQSQSYLHCSNSLAEFTGNLDIETLGGAGFASQRTTGDERNWDVSEYDGIKLTIVKGDDKRYTLILKDNLLPRDPDTGRDQASISYENDFGLRDALPSDSGDRTIFIPWKAFTATYRGREKENAPSIDLANVKRISIMNRSFFGEQDGDFTLTLKSISATSSSSNRTLRDNSSPEDVEAHSEVDDIEKPPRMVSETALRSSVSWILGCFKRGP